MGHVALSTTQAETSLPRDLASAHASRRREAAPGPTEGTPPPPHCLLKGLLCFPPCTLQGAQFSPQRPLPVTRVHTLKPPRAPRPTPPCPAQMVLKLRAQSRRPAGSLHPPSAATPPPCRPGPRGCQAGPQVTSRDTAVTPHHPGQPPFCVPCPSLKGGCPSCPVLEFSPLSTDPPRRTPSIQLDS